ncbi:hypothetical protein BS47DRAFT_1393204 [Hydnum rufescens UP504]|uniref:Uncharacterized protein n=1 Tax=Hydnum rufescens UP504 TaxID=1448309 RepID=A0A9P6AX64_9AGAM|nr:hypothetical protein BS47DRAFT_1393204 [Hydnum rufescens UP504]
MRPARSSHAGQKRKADTHDFDGDPSEVDKVEPGLHAPNSAYDACRESFIAADGDRVKASTQFFEDTGVMAFLCHHDLPLAVASMWTPGEKQFYVFALLETLLNHLLGHWRVGALYDIGCQMDQSLKKWKFRPEWLPRFEWGVSIFHAYGHQWACQLWYHPHKSEHWGLSDGEGCERFWSQLCRLIPGLRVTGYHRGLFILDLQMEHIDQVKRVGMGKWLQDQLDQAQRCMEEAEMKLGNHSISYLLDQFKAQQGYHSQPVSRQSQTKGAQAIERIISLTATLESQKENLKDAIAEGINLVEGESTASNLVQAEWQEKVQLLREAIQCLEGTIKKKTDELQLSDWTSAAELSWLKRDKWVNVQLNLHVLWEQLLRKLRARKFELATLDHANSSCILDQKTKAHVEKAVKSRSGGIEATVKKYNAKLKELGLYQLDVDQDIWEDSRGDIADFPDGIVPPWLGDPSVKEGIQLSQEIANCCQELERCKAEHANLQTWFCEEYSRVMEVFMGSEDEDVSYFALHQANQLYEWMTAWKKDMVQVPISSGAPSWDNICRPLPLQEHHAVWTQVQHEMEFDATAISDLQPPLTTRRNERSSADYDSDASSDDTEGGELEESLEPQEASLIVAMDQASVEEA